jgi:hypothetical protein
VLSYLTLGFLYLFVFCFVLILIIFLLFFSFCKFEKWLLNITFIYIHWRHIHITSQPHYGRDELRKSVDRDICSDSNLTMQFQSQLQSIHLAEDRTLQHQFELLPGSTKAVLISTNRGVQSPQFQSIVKIYPFLGAMTSTHIVYLQD